MPGSERLARPRRVAAIALGVVAVIAVAACEAGSNAQGDDIASTVPELSPTQVPPNAAPVTTTTAPAEPTSTSTVSTIPGISTTSTVSASGTVTSTTAEPSTTTTVPTTTRCTTVAHIGDSTSVALFEPEFMPDPGDALPAQYERVGVLALYTEVSGGRSIVETLGGEENAFDTVVRLREMGYGGCWVVTLGTNDAANVAIGGVPDLTTRLDRMMFLFGSDPVLWVDAVTNLDDGPYADVNMQSWNAVLDAAEARFPTLRVLRWSDVALDEWFVSDGIHYTTGGAAWRSHAIADALVAAFPAGGP